MKISIVEKYKSIPAGISFDLPDFCIITGRNGSGKSHLLEAMSKAELSAITDDERALSKIHLIGFGGLNPQMDEACDPQQIAQTSKSWWSQIETFQERVRNARRQGQQIPERITDFIAQWGHSPDLFNVVNNVMSRSSKSFEDLSEDDVYFNFNVSQAGQTLFASQLAFVFKTYHIRYTKNEFKVFLNTKNNTDYPTLSDQEFIKKYGPKPWLLVNEILSKAGLTYEVVSPEAIDTESTYKLRLVDRVSGSDISVNDLSTGEKVLMSLALAIYNTHEASGKPDVLILDEPDAPLHPQYSRLLIDTLIDVIVRKAGVRVVITTHSPSTAALSPNNSLFEMNRETKIPEMISLSRGIEVLTDGIPHLRISIDSRRQIFVESKYDVLYFERLYRIVNRVAPVLYQPIFLEPHSGSSNCSDVESIVSRLHDAGSDVVRGIVDWDGTKSTKYPIYVLGEGGRYAIENYLLDPLYIALSLIRVGKKTLSDFGVNGLVTYVDASRLAEQDAQSISDVILGKTGLASCDLASCKLQNGWSLNLPKAFLTLRGHDWEALLIKTFPELQAVSTRNGDAGLKLGVLKVIEEFPQFLSRDIFETFANIK